MSEFRNDMDKVWEEIREAADDVEVPDRLLPEQMVEALKKNQEKQRGARMRRITEMAAAIAVVAAVGGAGIYHITNTTKYTAENTAEKEQAVEAAWDSAESSDAGLEMEVDEKLEKSSTVGDQYHLAEDYEEIYKLVQNTQEKYEFMYDDVQYATAESTSTASNKKQDKEGSIADLAEDSAGNAENSVSSTNKQEEGVDESDLVKIDGNYVYRVWKNRIYIVDIQNKKMKLVSTITFADDPSVTVREIYLDGDTLCVLSEERESNLNKKKKDTYYMDGKTATKLSIYDISDSTNPVLAGSTRQDGAYYTSRKVNDVVYVFTNKELYHVSEKEDVIPYVQGKQVESDCIYVSNGNLSEELIATSVNMNEPEKIVDQMVIINPGATIYMGEQAMYLYSNDFSSDQEYTDIAKFSYDADGYMMGEQAASVKGSIEDTFAISEKKDTLRVLTTDWSGPDRVNQLYLLDKDMQLTGQIEDIAKGESIYAARYVGDIAYFITYRNTDPLFVADLSDTADPKLLGSVKISGFSDYLHPYGKNRMLGIGYETDKNSMKLGVKLCMFDVKNPKKPKVLNAYVMNEADSTPADANYKCVLVDAQRNLIGFLVEDYEAERPYTYKVFSWKKGTFKEVFSKQFKTKEYMDVNEVRGMYAGTTFYLVKNSALLSYDMENGYQKIDSITLN